MVKVDLLNQLIRKFQELLVLVMRLERVYFILLKNLIFLILMFLLYYQLFWQLSVEFLCISLLIKRK